LPCRRPSIAYEDKLDQAKAGLTHCVRCHRHLRWFRRGPVPQTPTSTPTGYSPASKIKPLAKKALLKSGSRELVIHIMAAKELDTGDEVLGKAIASRMIHAHRQQCRTRGREEAWKYGRYQKNRHSFAIIWTVGNCTLAYDS